jgi:acyl-CoA thioesterase-1
MLARLAAAVPNGTNIVILEPGRNDERRGQGSQTAGNISAIKSRLAARGIRVITVERTRLIAPARSRDPDGQHYGVEGHTAVASYLLPQVMSAVRGR